MIENVPRGDVDGLCSTPPLGTTEERGVAEEQQPQSNIPKTEKER